MYWWCFIDASKRFILESILTFFINVQVTIKILTRNKDYNKKLTIFVIDLDNFIWTLYW